MSSAIMVIPARAGSKGVPKKNIRPLAGTPLIAHLISAAKKSDNIDKVYISTDGDDIAQIAKEFGADVIRRPNDIAGDTASSESAILHTLDALEEQKQILPQFVYFAQCTSPLTQSEDLDRAMTIMKTGNYDSIFAAKPFHGFIWRKNTHEEMEGINHDHTKRRQMRQEMSPEFQEIGAFYLMKTELFREKKQRFFGRIGICEIPEERSVDIDTLEDFEIAENYLKVRL